MQPKNIKKIIIIVFALVAIASGFYFAFRKSKGVEAAWYGDSWLYRKKITIDHIKVKAKLNNFPVLASTTDSSLASYAQADGDDILFTSSDGRTKLNHEIEKYDSATGQLVSWVQAGLSSTTDTVLYMYYGNSSCGEQSTSTLVWDSNYVGVWHLNDDLINSITNIAATDNGTLGYSAGQIGNGREGDSSSINDNLSTDITPSGTIYTLEAWAKTDGVSSTWESVAGVHDNNNHRLYIGIYDNGTGDKWVYGAGDQYKYPTSISASTSMWYQVVITLDGSNVKFYVNGVEQTIEALSYSWVGENSVVFEILNVNRPTEEHAWDGKVDEVRISNTARSADWIATEYNNQSSPSTFMTWGDHQSKTALYGAGGLPPILRLKFDEGYGTIAYDSSGYGNDATITGPAWKNEVFCKTGKCLNFDGVNDYLTRAYDTDFNFSTSSFSLSTWFLASAVSASSTIASRYDSAGWKLWMDADGDLCFGIDDDSTWGGATPDDSACTTDKNYDDNTWHHLTASRDGTTGIYLYADGIQVASDTSLSATNSLSGTAPALYLGVENNGTSSPFTGRLDDFKIYGYARNATQVAADYGAPGTIRGASVSLGSRATSTISGAPDLTTGLVGYWDFEFATSSDKIVDRSENESYGMLGGGTAAAMPSWTNQGKKGRALKFDGGKDGGKDYVTITDPPDGHLDFGTGSFSLSFWMLTSTTTFNIPISKGSYSVPGYDIYNTPLSTMRLNLHLYGNNGGVDLSGAVPLNTWVHYVGVVDRSSGGFALSGYNQGVLYSTYATTTNMSLSNAYNLSFGIQGYPFEGLIDEVRIYNRALSQREIAWLYNEGKPLAEWHFRNNYNDTGSWCENNAGTSECKALTAAGSGNTFATSTLELETSSLRLNGSGYATIADDVNLDVATGTDFSLTATFMTTDTGNVVLAAKRNTDSGAGYLLGLDYGLGDGKIFFEVGDGTDEFQIQGATNLADGVWHTVTVVFDDDSATGNKIYVDGRDDTAATSGTLINVGPLSNALAFVVGAESDGGGAIHAKIDRVAFYGYALTAEDAKRETLGAKAVKIGQHVADSQGSDPLGGKPPVGWWKLDERSGTTAADYASSTLNGTWNGAGNHFVPGKVGYAGQFNDSDDYISVTENGAFDLDGGGITTSAWVKTNISEANNVIFSKGVSWEVGINADGDLTWDGSVAGQDDASTAVTANTWHYITITNNDATVTYYVDGKKTGTDTSGIAANNDTTFYIGYDGTNYFDGLIDNVKIYDYVRSAAQVAWDYNQGKPRAHWKFDEGAGATTQDASENNYDGTITGATWSTSGKIFNALSFDGSGDEVSTADIAISGETTYNEVSFGAWVNPSTSIASKAILVKNTEFRLVTDSTGRALCEIHNGTDWQVAATSTNPLSLGTWQHVMCYYDKTNLKLYLNGQQDNSVALTQSVSNSAVTFEIGDDVGGTYGDYQGLIDDVRIYNYARPASFILQDYNNGMSARF